VVILRHPLADEAGRSGSGYGFEAGAAVASAVEAGGVEETSAAAREGRGGRGGSGGGSGGGMRGEVTRIHWPRCNYTALTARGTSGAPVFAEVRGVSLTAFVIGLSLTLTIMARW
jgi:hypothetical protein